MKEYIDGQKNSRVLYRYGPRMQGRSNSRTGDIGRMSPALLRGLVPEFGKARSDVLKFVHDVFQQVHLQIVLVGWARDRGGRERESAAVTTTTMSVLFVFLSIREECSRSPFSLLARFRDIHDGGRIPDQGECIVHTTWEEQIEQLTPVL
jgi:hypothetical protein